MPASVRAFTFPRWKGFGGRSRVFATAGALALLTGVAGFLRFDRLGLQSFWVDEVVTWNLLHRSLWSLLRHGIPSSESTPPLYYVVAWIWVRLFGWSETALRSLSALVGTATVPVAYLAARTLAGARAALVAALLVAVSPILVWSSQEARAYALFAFLAALSLLFFARLFRRYSRIDLVAWSTVAVLALTTHYFALFLLLAEAAFLGRRLPRRPLVLALGAPSMACLLLAPLAWVQRSHPSGLASSTALSSRLTETAQWFAGGGLRSWPVWIVVAAVVLRALFLLLAAAEPPQRRGGLLALALAGVAGMLPVALALAGKDYVFFRNDIALWLPLAIVLAVGLANRRFVLPGLAGAAALVAVFAYADVSVWTRPALQRDNYRLLAGRLPHGPETVVVYPGWDTVPLEHYQPRFQPVLAPRLRPARLSS